MEENERSEDPDRAADHSSASHRRGSINLVVKLHYVFLFPVREEQDAIVCARNITVYDRSHLDERPGAFCFTGIKNERYDVAINMTPGAI